MKENLNSIVNLTETTEEINEIRNEKKKTKEANTNFIKIFKPMFYCSAVLFLRKCSLKDDRFTVNSNWYSLPCILAGVGIVILFVKTLQDLELLFGTEICMLFTLVYSQFIIQYLILCTTQFLMKKENLKLMKNLQDIYAFLYIKKDVLKIRIRLLFPCILYIVLYSTHIFRKLLLDPTWSCYRGALTCVTLIFELEMIYACFIIYFLAYNTKQWTQIVVNMNPSTGDDNILEKLTTTFEKLILAADLMRRVFSVTIFYHFVTNFTRTLCYIQLMISSVKSQEEDVKSFISLAIGLFFWIVKGFALDTTLCFYAEQLYRCLDSTKHIVIYKLYQEGNNKSTQKFAKNILRLCDTKFVKMTACGVFTVDAALPLRLASVVATYTVVLLQFAFL